MPDPGEWFSPRTRPEMLTSDDPAVPGDKPELVRILAGPPTTVGRATAPLRRVVDIVPAIGRRLVRLDGEQPSRWQVAGMWTSGFAIVAAAGLVVASVIGGAPAALTQPFEHLPGIGNEQPAPDTSHSTDKAASADVKRAAGPGRTSDGGPSSAIKGSGGSATSVVYPVDLVPGRPAVPGMPSAGAPFGANPSTGGPSGGGSSAGPPAGAPATATPPAGQPGTGGTTAPPPGDPTTPTNPPTDPATPTDPGTTTDPGTPTTDPTTPPADPGTPPPDPTTPPADPPPADPTTDPAPPTTPADQPPADPPATTQDQPVTTAPTDPTPPPTTP